MTIYNLHTKKYESPDISKIGKIPMVAALGSFDGVHIGHQRLIKAAVADAEYRNAVSAAWMFSSLPKNMMISDPSEFVHIITSNDEKLRLFAELGLDYAVFEDFSSVRNFSPSQFVSDVLIKSLSCVSAVCGFNFRFGARGVGDSDTLAEIMNQNGCSVTVIPPVFYQKKIVSSSAIRLMIADGAMEDAEKLLGHTFSISFPVVSGKQLGRTIGIPTINQNFPEGHIIPKTGIYACTCEVGEDIFLGVSNVGMRPTVDIGATPKINCETHIINYNGWLYGKNIRVNFYKRLRDEKKFSGIDELKEAISNDIKNAVDYFSLM